MSATSIVDASSQAEARRFHVRMAGLFLLIAFGGFYPTYWARVADGSFHQPPIVHIHGMLLFAWILLYFLQTALVASGRTPAHRAWGMVGVSLFSVLVCVIIVTKVTLMNIDEARGFGLETKRFAAVVFGALPLMIGLFVAAIANVRRPETHKRLMFVLMAGMMTPAVARLFLTFLAPPGAAAGGPPPPFVSIPPAAIGVMCVIGAMVYDWRIRGRPHKVYVYGVLLLIVQPIAAVLMANTDWWLNVAATIERLGG
jgi:ABC-type multidrug transport system fused ATPase/permease subunit